MKKKTLLIGLLTCLTLIGIAFGSYLTTTITHHTINTKINECTKQGNNTLITNDDGITLECQKTTYTLTTSLPP